MKINRIFFLYKNSSLLEAAAMEGYLKNFKEKFRGEFFWIFGINLYPGPTLFTLSQVSAIRGNLRIGHTVLIRDKAPTWDTADQMVLRGLPLVTLLLFLPGLAA